MIYPHILKPSEYEIFLESLSQDNCIIYRYINDSLISTKDILDSAIISSGDIVMATRAGSKSRRKYIMHHAISSILEDDKIMVHTIILDDQELISRLLVTLIYLFTYNENPYTTIIFPFKVDTNILDKLDDIDISYGLINNVLHIDISK